MNETKPKKIATIDRVDYWQETDLLKRWEEPNDIYNPNGREHIAIEEYKVDKINTPVEGWTLGLCYNSIPVFARLQDMRGTTDWPLFAVLNVRSCCLRNGTYNRLCPKIAWGIMAVVLAHSYWDTENNWLTWKSNANNVYDSYLNNRKQLYKAINKRKYEHWQHDGGTEAAEQLRLLDKRFCTELLTDERSLYERTLATIEQSKDFMNDGTITSFVEAATKKAQQLLTRLANEVQDICKPQQGKETPRQANIPPVEQLPFQGETSAQSEENWANSMADKAMANEKYVSLFKNRHEAKEFAKWAFSEFRKPREIAEHYRKLLREGKVIVEPHDNKTVFYNILHDVGMVKVVLRTFCNYL